MYQIERCMLKIGLIREGKIPADNRVPLTPSQCKWLHKNFPDIKIIAQQSTIRCYSDKEYLLAGVEVKEDMSECDVLLGIKEVPLEMLIAGKTYLFFSHTKKLQPHNQKLIRTIIENYNNDSITTENLLKIKEYYFKKKYLHRILDRLDD